jgi:hypothetical protein
MQWLGVERRRLGTGLLVFGMVGVILAGIIAVGLVGGAIAARNLDDRLVADQARLTATLDRLTVTIDKLATSTDHAGATLQSSSALVTEAGLVLRDAAAATEALSQGLNFNVLGQQPLAGAATRFHDLAGRISVFADGTGTLASNLGTNAADLADLADRTREIGADVRDLSARLSAFDRTGQIVNLIIGGILLGGLLVAWVAVAAALCAWAGWRLRRTTDAIAGAEPPVAVV